MSEVYQFSRANRTVWWPVKINVPQDGGEVNAVTIEMQLSIPKKDEAREAGKLEQAAFEQYMLKRVLDWRGVVDEENTPLRFSEAMLSDLMQDQYFEVGVTTALMKAAVGAREKN